MKKLSALTIDERDIAVSGSGLSSGNRSKMTRQSRSLSITGKAFTLTHKPTGVSVSGEVTPGHYSRREMQRLVAELRAHLLVELHRAVARKLRLRGMHCYPKR